ncbi:hypothetical protein [Bdellovibrio sp. HCB-162]|uniref:hypothetical protein n=1 Tax=Bdellovibrio sp. HCB-162 TaxID=3394234 RepID=UPI0039BD92A5
MKSIRRSKNAFIESENGRTFLALTLIEVRENKILRKTPARIFNEDNYKIYTKKRGLLQAGSKKT